MIPVDVIVSTAGGVLATLAGVLVGGLQGSRSQTQQWFRAEQVQVCADVLRESTKILLEFERAGRQNRKQQVDWGPWNEVLATISVVADQSIVDAAVRIDECFWDSSDPIDALNLGYDEWVAIRDRIELRRLEFINVSRRVLGRSGSPLQQILGRPAHWKPIASSPAKPPEAHGPAPT